LYLSHGTDLSERNHQTVAQLPVPASYVIDTDGIVRFAFIEEDHTMRAEPAVLLDEVRKLNAAQP